MMARNKSFSLPGGPQGIEAVVAAADRIAGVQRNVSGIVTSGNKALSDNLMGSFEFNSRQAGRMDLGMHNYTTGKADTDGAWAKASLQQHAQGTGTSMQVFADDAIKTLQSRSTTREQKKNAAVRIMELQNLKPYATADNQARINKALSGAGIDFASGVSVEQQLEVMSGVGGTAPAFSSTELRALARVYDQTQERGTGAAPGTASAPPPPPSGP
jgi:hypothetical protein